VLSQEGNVVLDGLLETKGNAPEGMLQRFFAVAVQAEVKIVGSIDANDSILQRLKLTEIDMLASPLVKLLDCRRLSVHEVQGSIGWSLVLVLPDMMDLVKKEDECKEAQAMRKNRAC